MVGSIPNAWNKLRPRLKLPSVVCWIAFLLLIVYPLSVRPVGFLISKGILPGEAFEIYKPLYLVTKVWSSLNDFLNWYVNFGTSQ
jgi:hypothetical protein